MTPACPYPGLVPFNETNSHFFYGRERETQELLQRLHRHPLVAVVGRSGCGKSSLVFAGLVPALEQSELFSPGDWLIRQMRPHQKPLARLANALQGSLENTKQTVSRLLAQKGSAQRLLLIVDQFEELFTTAPFTEQREFQRKIIQLTSIPNCYVILIIRADFFANLVESPIWPAIQAHRMLVQPLEVKQWRQVIMRPAQDVGLLVEQKLVEHLTIEAASKPERLYLPQLQQTLTLLCQKAENSNLSLKAYEELADQSRTGLQIAIEYHADRVLAALSTAQQAIAQRLFLRLVHFNDNAPHTPRQQTGSQLQAGHENEQEFEHTLQQFASSGLLTLSGNQKNKGEQQINLPHAALIEHWPTLQQWLNELREAEQTRRDLEEKVTTWLEVEHNHHVLLTEGELQAAEQWLASPEAQNVGVSAQLATFIAASRKALRWHRLRKIAIILAYILIAALLGFLYLSIVGSANGLQVSLF